MLWRCYEEVVQAGDDYETEEREQSGSISDSCGVGGRFAESFGQGSEQRSEHLARIDYAAEKKDDGADVNKPHQDGKHEIESHIWKYKGRGLAKLMPLSVLVGL